MADLTLKIISANLASDGIKAVASSVKDLAGSVVNFAKESIKAFEEQERADKQLALVAGQLTETFKAQASAFQESLGVSDDMVEKMQTLALTMGAAPAQVQVLTAAILDYSARTGTDAVGATDMLIKGVMNGSGHIKALGITYQATGDFTKDLATATEALAKKYAGAAAADADTLAGSVRKANEAFGEFKESFGGLIAEFVQKTGVVNDLTWSLKQLQAALFPEKADRRSEIVKQLEDIRSNLKLGIGYEGVEEEEKTLQRELELLDQKAKAIEKNTALAMGAPGTGKEFKQPKDKAKGESYEGGSSDAEELRLFGLSESDVEKQLAEEEAFRQHQVKLAKEAYDAEIKAQEDFARELAESSKIVHASFLSDQKEAQRKESQQLEKHLREQEAMVRAQAAMYASAGDAIGAAFVSGFTQQLGELANGGEFDVGAFLGDLVSTIGSILGTVFGTVIGMPQLGAALGGGLGSLAGGGIKAAFGSKKRHDGGWADDNEVPRFHDGGWPGSEIPAILQSGERVLSRTEVSRMGGPGGVDRAASGRGGGTVNLTVNSLDSRSTSEFFEARGGRGFQNAIRSGRGDVARLFIGGRR